MPDYGYDTDLSGNLAVRWPAPVDRIIRVVFRHRLAPRLGGGLEASAQLMAPPAG
jgi:hypothetical protein